MIKILLNKGWTSSKVGCVYSMVMGSEFRMGQYKVDDHRGDAPHFTSSCYPIDISTSALSSQFLIPRKPLFAEFINIVLPQCKIAKADSTTDPRTEKLVLSGVKSEIRLLETGSV